MKIKLKHFLQLESLAPVLLRTGIISEDAVIRGICLLDDPNRFSFKQADMVIIPALINKGQIQIEWQSLTTKMIQTGVTVLAYKKGSFSENMLESWNDVLTQTDLPVLELAENIDLAQLITQLTSLFTVSEAGEAVYKTQVLHQLRQTVEEERIKGLLKELHRWLDCQAIAMIKHDVHAYPPITLYDETYMNTQYWESRSPFAFLPWVEHFYVPQHQEYILRCNITYEGYPQGNIIISRKDEDFDENACLLLDYSSILCAGLNHNYIKSQRIHDLLELAYNNEILPEDELALISKQGYALVLREHKKTLSQDLNNSFLGYLIHNSFDKEIYYCFLENADLLIYSAAANINSFVDQLKHLLKENKRHFVFGISGLYPREKLALAFAEAKHAVGIGQLLEGENDIYHFHDLGIYRLFNYPDNGWTINQMLNEMTEQLYTFDPEKRQILTSTLTCLVKNNFNYSKTAEEMYAHPNTIRYRISLLEQLWNRDLSKDQDKLLFSLIGKLLPLWIKYTCYVP